MARLFRRVPHDTLERASEAVAATARVREAVRPTLQRAHEIADEYEDMDRVLERHRQ